MEKEQLHEDITKQVIDVIFNALNLKHIDRTAVTTQTPLTKGGLELDSVDILELIVNLEQVYGIKLNESEAYAQYFTNIGTVVDFVKSQKRG